MDKLLSLQQKIVPEVIPLLLSRYQILRSIRYLQPVGRRALAEKLQLQERKIRNEVDVLKEHELVSYSPAGMQVTPDGDALLWELEEYIREIQGLRILEDQIAALYQVKQVIMVPGDSDGDQSVKKDLARVTAQFLLQNLTDGAILAVTGGTTLAEVANILPTSQLKRSITVVPARGGLGEDVEIQANTVAANIAKGVGANYRLLHAPDDLRVKTMQTIAGEPKIKEVLDLLRQADMVLHGIGSAEEITKRRGMTDEKIKEILSKGAVGEAFGYYFAQDGTVVHSTSSVGLQLNELEFIDEVVAVAGGKSKAMAVKAVLSNAPRDILIIDEGAARALVDDLGKA
jgi:central glycolytic genes regulator